MNTLEAQDRKASTVADGARAARQPADPLHFGDTAERQPVPTTTKDAEEPYSNVPCTD
jgi:hypothetical protein